MKATGATALLWKTHEQLGDVPGTPDGAQGEASLEVGPALVETLVAGLIARTPNLTLNVQYR